jgi:hypothetical protein
MLFVANVPIFSGERQLRLYRIATAPSANTSFSVDVLNVSEKELSTNYWKSREWEAMAPHFHVPTVTEQKSIVRAVFESKEEE